MTDISDLHPIEPRDPLGLKKKSRVRAPAKPPRPWTVALALFSAGLAGAISCSAPYPPPPETRREPVVDTIHGIAIADGYRWLEDQESPETRAWIEQQNAYADTVIGNRSLRTELTTRLRALTDDHDIGSPRGAGEYEYFTMRRKSEELPVIYRRAAPEEPTRIDPAGEYEVIIDPHKMSSDLTTRVGVVSISPDARYLIYSLRDGGQDEVEIRVMDVEAREDLPDRLPNGLYSGLIWKGDGSGFYYSHRSRQDGARIYFHTLGGDVAGDVELFGDGYGPDKFVNLSQVNDGRYHIYTVWHGWTRVEVHFRDVAADGPVTTIAGPELDARFYPQYLDGELYMRTNLEAPNNRVVAIDLANPERENWREVIPEGEDVMQGFSLIDDKFYVTYHHNVSTQIKVFDKDGTPAGAVEIPAYHSASIWSGGEGAAYLNLASFTTPSVTYRIDLETSEREVWQQREIDFDPAGIEVKQVWYSSKDGTRVPMFVMHRQDIELTGDVPTLLYGYGGFNVSLVPRFDPTAAIWVERGGVYAMANLRGGSEFGERWHRAGMLENKQNVFDDFIAAAEWLIAEGYTNSDALAIRGYSNGGLLVASALTQRPDLFRAVVCGFPDLDMVRFYTFTQNNNLPALHEYGDASKREQFEFLRAYSPYQAVRRGVKYPAVMLSQGDLDTRVPPLQARKMTATLQWATRSGLPVILRYDPKAGHAGNRGQPFSRRIEWRATELAFLLSQLGDPQTQGHTEN